MSTRTIRSLRNLITGSGIVLSLATAGCCMTSGSSDPGAVAPLPSVAIPAAPTVVAPSGTQVLTLGAGFVPDPTTVSTIAGGSIPASSLPSDGTWCAGNVGLLPNITLTTTTPIMGLRVLVRSSSDTTVAVHLADGRWICDDDGGGYPNPAAQADFPAGVHQIYVGAFHTGETPAATVGFTTSPVFPNAALP